jgi:hypothetical protein
MKEEMDISKLALGTIQPKRCSHCGTTHDFISVVAEGLYHPVVFRAIDHCPRLDKRNEEPEEVPVKKRGTVVNGIVLFDVDPGKEK